MVQLTLITTHAPTDNKEEETKNEFIYHMEETKFCTETRWYVYHHGHFNGKIWREEILKPHLVKQAVANT